MIINSEILNGETIYNFESRGVAYTVFTKTDGFEVWSNRLAMSAMPSIRFFRNLKELASATKALKNLSALIAA
jgi:hypothetical protein